MNATLTAAVNDWVRMGWLFPESKVSAALMPDLVAQAREDGWDSQQFISKATPRIEGWVNSKLRIPNRHLMECTSQNFMARMMERRPDLFYVQGKGPLENYMTGILKAVFRETCRQERLSLHDGWADERADDKQRGPLALLEDTEELEAARQLIAECAPKDREALLEKYNTAFIPDTKHASTNATYIRRCRALKMIRRRAFDRGLRISEPRTYPGKSRHIRRRRSRLARPATTRPSEKRLRPLANSALIDGKIPVFTATTDGQAIVNESNARALKALLDNLPPDLGQRVEVLLAVREIFQREFARHLVSKRRASVDDNTSNERPGS